MPRSKFFLRLRSALVISAIEITASVGAVPSAAPPATPVSSPTSMLIESPAVAQSSNTPQSAALLVNLINVARARENVPPLLIDADLVVAASARQGDRSPATELSAAALIADHLQSPWTRGGVISGNAPSAVDFLDAAFASDGHRAVLMDPGFTRIGIAVQLDDDGASIQQLLADG